MEKLCFSTVPLCNSCCVYYIWRGLLSQEVSNRQGWRVGGDVVWCGKRLCFVV